MKAVLLVHTKEVRDDGSIVEVVVWELAQPLPHRLFYGTPGTDRVRYDNERGKGDHRHVGGGESPYLFSSIDRLLDDFERDIKDWSPS